MAELPHQPNRVPSDEDLMCDFQKGDVRAFQVLVERYQKPIFNFVFRYLKNREAAEESHQEVFLRLVKAAGEYRPTAKFSTWLYTLARNFCIDQNRKNVFRNHQSLDEKIGNDETFSRLDRISSNEPGADDKSSAKQLEEHLYRILDELNPEQKDVFLMREMQQLSFEEIAEITKVSSNTVKSRMRYALQAIQKKFAELGLVSRSFQRD